MVHDADDEGEERENVLEDEEFVPGVTERGEGAEVQPYQEDISFDA